MPTSSNTESARESYRQLVGLVDRIKRERLFPVSSVPELTDSEARVVLAISRVEASLESLRSGVLAQLVQVTPSALSQIVKSLVKKGVVERKHRSEDYRVVYVSLTERGRELSRRLSDAYEQDMIALIDYIGLDEVEHLVRALRKVIDYYEGLAAQGKAYRVLDGLDDADSGRQEA